MPKNAIKPSVFVEKMVIQANLFASYDYAGLVFELSIVSELSLWSQRPQPLSIACKGFFSKKKLAIRAQKTLKIHDIC